MALTAKQQVFVAEYLIDLNATQAAIRAGYSEKTAPQQGARLFINVKVQTALQDAMKAREGRTEITQDRVLQEYAKLAFLDPRRFYDDAGSLIAVNMLDADVAAALVGVEVLESRDPEGGPSNVTKKIKFVDKKGALDSIARHLGMFKDKLEHSGEVKTPELRLILNGINPSPAAK
jgi:phage terminase small subunit